MAKSQFALPYFGCRASPPHYEDSLANSGVHRELVAILKEIRVITDKLRDDEAAANIGGRSTAD